MKSSAVILVAAGCCGHFPLPQRFSCGSAALGTVPQVEREGTK